MNEITYLFGAGASCQAMPLVTNFARRYSIFKEYVTTYTNRSESLGYDIKEFGDAVSSHSTFDTFFKKLFHQKDTRKQRNRYKSILLLYFLFEHLIDLSELEYIHLYKLEKEKHQHKTLNLDPRYEALIAGLLRPLQGRTDFYTPINFITWNYDVNLLYALKNFIAPEASFSNFLLNSGEENVFQITPQVKVIHLNGVINHPVLDDFNKVRPQQFFKEFISSYPQQGDTKYEENIKFAWEQKEFPADIIESCIQKSKQLNIVGYSLPLYNRDVDSIILDHKKLQGKKIFIQDTAPENIVDLLESDFNISSTRPPLSSDGKINIKTTSNCNSFNVPTSMFN